MSDSHKTCYGQMLPSVFASAKDTPAQGKAFSYLVRQQGTVVGDRQIRVDLDQWDDCMACEEFESCHQLCMTKLALESAITRW